MLCGLVIRLEIRPGNADDPSSSICMMSGSNNNSNSNNRHSRKSVMPWHKATWQTDGIWRWLKVTLLTFWRSEAAALEKRYLFFFLFFFIVCCLLLLLHLQSHSAQLIKIIFNLWIRDKYSLNTLIALVYLALLSADVCRANEPCAIKN